MDCIQKKPLRQAVEKPSLTRTVAENAARDSRRKHFMDSTVCFDAKRNIQQDHGWTQRGAEVSRNHHSAFLKRLQSYNSAKEQQTAQICQPVASDCEQENKAPSQCSQLDGRSRSKLDRVPLQRRLPLNSSRSLNLNNANLEISRLNRIPKSPIPLTTPEDVFLRTAHRNVRSFPRSRSTQSDRKESCTSKPKPHQKVQQPRVLSARNQEKTVNAQNINIDEAGKGEAPSLSTLLIEAGKIEKYAAKEEGMLTIASDLRTTPIIGPSFSSGYGYGFSIEDLRILEEVTGRRDTILTMSHSSVGSPSKLSLSQFPTPLTKKVEIGDASVSSEMAAETNLNSKGSKESSSKPSLAYNPELNKQIDHMKPSNKSFVSENLGSLRNLTRSKSVSSFNIASRCKKSDAPNSCQRGQTGAKISYNKSSSVASDSEKGDFTRRSITFREFHFETALRSQRKQEQTEKRAVSAVRPRRDSANSFCADPRLKSGKNEVPRSTSLQRDAIDTAQNKRMPQRRAASIQRQPSLNCRERSKKNSSLNKQISDPTGRIESKTFETKSFSRENEFNGPSSTNDNQYQPNINKLSFIRRQGSKLEQSRISGKPSVQNHEHSVSDKPVVSNLQRQEDFSKPRGHSSPFQASPLKASPLKASPVKASPLKASPLKASPLKASPLKAFSLKATPLEASPIEASSMEASPIEASPIEASSMEASSIEANGMSNTETSNTLEAGECKSSNESCEKLSKGKVNAFSSFGFSDMHWNPKDIFCFGMNDEDLPMKGSCIESLTKDENQGNPEISKPLPIPDLPNVSSTESEIKSAEEQIKTDKSIHNNSDFFQEKIDSSDMNFSQMDSGFERLMRKQNNDRLNGSIKVESLPIDLDELKTEKTDPRSWFDASAHPNHLLDNKITTQSSLFFDRIIVPHKMNLTIKKDLQICPALTNDFESQSLVIQESNNTECEVYHSASRHSDKTSNSHQSPLPANQGSGLTDTKKIETFVSNESESSEGTPLIDLKSSLNLMEEI